MRKLSKLCLALVVAILLTLSPTAAKQNKNGVLIIEDPHLAAWMSLSNQFNSERVRPWEGVLIQVGFYFEEEGTISDFFDSITFSRRGVTLLRLGVGDFKWINIVGAHAAGDEPMKPEHAALLWPDPDAISGCAAFNACTESAVCRSPSPVAFEPCLRLSSLHGFFRPRGIVTYWQGTNGYSIAAESITLEGETRYTFSFNDPVEISVDGSLLDIGPIDTIRLNPIDFPNHGGKHDPGWP